MSVSKVQSATVIINAWRCYRKYTCNQLFNDAEVLKLTPYGFAEWLFENGKEIKKALLNPHTSFLAQKEFKKLFQTKFDQTVNELPVFSALGGRNEQGWFPPKMFWSKVGDASSFSNYHGCLFTRPLTSGNEHYHQVREKDVKNLFSIIRSSTITWEINDDGCHLRAHFACQLLIASNIDPKKILKLYCFGGKLINKWDWHCACALLDDHGTCWIIDPSVNSEMPLLKNEWLLQICCEKHPTFDLDPIHLPFHLRNDAYLIFNMPSHQCLTLKDKFKTICLEEESVVAKYFYYLAINKTRAACKLFPELRDCVGDYLPPPFRSFVVKKTNEKKDHDLTVHKLIMMNERYLIPTDSDILALQVSFLNREQKFRAIQMLRALNEKIRRMIFEEQGALLKAIEMKLGELAPIR